MKSFLFLTTLLVILSACDSPRNHRVESGGGTSGESMVSLQSFKNSDLKISAKWLVGPHPVVNKPSTLIVYIYNSEGNLVSLPDGEQINFYASMVSMGHGLDQPGYFTEISPGIFLNTEISFNMSGDWSMELWLQDADYNIKDKIVWPDFLQP